jgi:ribosomal protein L22
MLKYARNPRPEKSVKVYGRNLRISSKDSAIVCRAISNTTVAKARHLLQNLSSEKVNLDGKYYTKTVNETLNLLRLAEGNAESKGMDADRLLVHASAHQGFTYQTPRRFKLARRQAKMTNLQIVLEER